MSIRQALAVVAGLETDHVIDRYAVCGALAAFYYLEPAATEDLDILVRFDASGANSLLVTLGPILAALAAKGFDKFHKEGVIVAGFPVQFVPVSDALDHEALHDAELVDIPFPEETLKIRILRAEHLAAMALRLGRPKDKARLAEFLTNSVFDQKRFEAIVKRHNLSIAWASFLSSRGQ